MKADDAGFVGGVEVAGDGVTNHGFQLVKRVGVREDGKAESAGFVASFGGLLNGEDDFALGHELLAFEDYTLVGALLLRNAKIDPKHPTLKAVLRMGRRIVPVDLHKPHDVRQLGGVWNPASEA